MKQIFSRKQKLSLSFQLERRLGRSEYCGPAGVLSSERGLLLELLAICSFLLVIVLFGFAIDFPFTNAAVIRSQNALDYGATQSIYAFTHADEMARAAFINANAVMQNEFSGGIGPRYSSGLDSAASDHILFVPSFPSHHPYSSNTGKIWDDFKAYQCNAANGVCSAATSSPREAYFASIIDRNFDVNGVNDFRNSIMFYGKFTPYHFLPFLPDRPAQILSVVRMQNVMTYVLVDPSFPVVDEADAASTENFNLLFGQTMDSDGTNDISMWPVAADRKLDSGGSGAVINPIASKDAPSDYWGSDGFPHPTDGNLFYNRNPVTGTTYDAVTTGTTTAERIYRFYASSCDSMPFMYFKEGPINLLDRLSNSSAFNPTTLVGITGYSAAGALSLIPVHPANNDLGNVLVSSYPDVGDFPLPANATESQNAYLHSPKPSAFTGFVNSANPDPTATDPETNLNRWELCYCRGLYGQANPGDIVGYAAPEDLSSASSTDVTAHARREDRVRNTGLASNWCDDEYIAANPLSARVMDMGLGRSGTGATEPHETARNMIANLAIRPKDARIQTILNPTTSWQRPTMTEYGNGYRWLPGALSKACTQLKESADSYNADATYGITRPVTTKAISVYAFGIYSEAARIKRGDTAAQALAEFKDALKDCACSNPSTMIFLNFLPMSQADRNQISGALDIIKEFETDYNFSTIGLPSPFSSPCDNGQSNPVFTMTYDYGNARFAAPGGAAATVGAAKLAAAQAFATETFETINRLLIEYVFSS